MKKKRNERRGEKRRNKRRGERRGEECGCLSCLLIVTSIADWPHSAVCEHVCVCVFVHMGCMCVRFICSMCAFDDFITVSYDTFNQQRS